MEKRLCNLVDLVDNNRRCAVLALKEGTQPMDLIRLGGFNGDETMFRVSKDPKTISVTVFRDGRPPYTVSYGSSTTVVSQHEASVRDQIRECVNFDYGIFTNGYSDGRTFNALVEKTCGERTLDSERSFKLYTTKDGCSLHVNGQYVMSVGLDMRDAWLAERNARLDVQQIDGTTYLGQVLRIEEPELEEAMKAAKEKAAERNVAHQREECGRKSPELGL